MTNSEPTRKSIALLGAPNSGKSALFNMLTGMRQKVGNYSGVTVERKSGQLAIEGKKHDLIDLPGTYSLVARSQDEAIATRVLLGQMRGEQAPDAIVIVVDASNLERSLVLASQVLEFGHPCIVVLTMLDVAKRRGLSISSDKIAARLGVQVIEANPAKSHGKDAILEAMASLLQTPSTPKKSPIEGPLLEASEELAATLNAIASAAGNEGISQALALRLLCDDGELDKLAEERLGDTALPLISDARESFRKEHHSPAIREAQLRQAWARELVSVCADQSIADGDTRSSKIDQILTHRVYGLVIFLFIMAFVFQSIFAWSAPFMDAIEGLFGSLGEFAVGGMDEGPLKSLLSAAVVDGVGGVMVFLPQIVILFAFLALLEESGYMARAAFLMDRLLRPLGLTGRSFIPMLSGFACAIPAIMATRSIADRASRLTTIMVVPLTSCSARLPVYALMITLFVPDDPIALGFTMQGAVLLAMYLLGIVVAIPMALIFRKWIFRGKRSSFMIELPSYKVPQLKSLARTLFERSRLFVVNAGTIIFAMAIIIWALTYFPHSDSTAEPFDAEREALVMEEEAAQERFDALLAGQYSNEQLEDEEFEAQAADFPEAQQANFESIQSTLDAHADINHREAAAYTENSILGQVGKVVEPLFVPLGWDWRISTASIASFPAREVVIGVMGTIFSQGDENDEESEGLHDAITSATWPDGRPLFTLATALSIMVFFALCMQCGASVAAIKREMNSWKWAAISFAYMTVLAYVLALITFQVATVLIT